MKLLFDHNLSPRLVARLRDLYPDSLHVRETQLHTSDDPIVWDYAAAHGFTIVSKDSDFHQRSFVLGHPPKIVWIRLGNCSTAEIEAVLRDRHHELVEFGSSQEGSFLVLARRPV